jgi:hypothetical protein
MVPWYWIGLCFFSILIAASLLVSVVETIDERMDFIGLLPAIFAPCFTVGFVAAGWSQARGEMPQLSHLFSGFKADVKTLLGIGVVKVTSLWFSSKIFVTVFGGDFETELGNIDRKNPAEVLAFFTAPHLWQAVLVFVALLILIWMATWLAPMVVVFQRTGVVGAIRNSFRALSINWRALLIWILVPIVGVVAFWIALSVVTVALAFLVGAIVGKGIVSLILLLVLGLLLLAIPLLISLGTLTAFVAYCDIFHAKDAVFPRPTKTPAL